MEELDRFIQSNPEPRTLKRALAVQMAYQEYTYYEIRDVLKVSVGFISKWKQAFAAKGVEGLALQHKGSSGYLGELERKKVIDWLQGKNYWNLQELQYYIEEIYGVVFASKPSYYELFAEAGISWKKTQKRNPQAQPEVVEKKTRNQRVARIASAGNHFR